MNGLLLSLLHWSMERETAYAKGKVIVKIAGGAFGGSILACLFMVMMTKRKFFMQPVLIHALTGLIMVRITFPVRGFKNQLKLLVRLSLIEILMGGILNLFLFRREYGEPSYGADRLGCVPVIAAGIGVVVWLREILKDARREKQIVRHLYGVKFYHRGRVVEGTALLDTGNHLREPVTGKAVVIIEKELAKKLLGQMEVLSIMAFADGRKISCIPVNPVKMIPFHSLGEKNGIMPGVLIDKMAIQKERDERIYEKVQIGIMEDFFSGEDLYQVILHEEYIK
ncbi:MAG: sigma-E processing peptidase SpoIIGA [Bacteroidales bacterium]|nr:sigma-E processing peptidase SpoIIGA [Bacteroidales bacterium]